MLTRNGHTFVIIVVVLTTLSIILSSCAAHLTAMPTLPPTAIIAPTVTPTIAPTPVPFPALTLNPGDNYFSMDGKQSFLLSRNITGKTWDDFHTLLEWAHQGGSKVVRVHLTHGWWGDPWINKDWSVNEKWAQDWDRFFDEA